MEIKKLNVSELTLRQEKIIQYFCQIQIDSFNKLWLNQEDLKLSKELREDGYEVNPSEVFDLIQERIRVFTNIQEDPGTFSHYPAIYTDCFVHLMVNTYYGKVSHDEDIAGLYRKLFFHRDVVSNLNLN